MPKTLAVTLDDDQNRFVTDQIASAHYGSADEVVQAGLRLLAEQEAERDRIRAALIEGEQSGISNRSVDEIFASAMARFDSQHG